MNLFIAILRFPWWVHFAIAGLVVYFGLSMQDDIVQAEQDLAAALVAEAPDPTPLQLFQPNSHLASLGEGRILAQVNTDYNYRLIKKTNGITMSETAMYVLFGPEADESATQVQAVIMVAPRDVDTFADWAVERATNIGALGLVYDIHGRFSSSHARSGQARDALRDEGLTPAANLQFISPYLDGREAGLRKAASRDEGSQQFVYLVAAAFGMLGIAKFAFGRAFGGNGGARRRRGRPQPEPMSPVDTSQRPVPLMAEPGTPETAWANTDPSEVDTSGASQPPAETAPKPSVPAAQSVGPKATRAAKLMEKQRQLAETAQNEGQAAKTIKPRMSALEQARSFRKAASNRPQEAKYFRAKMKEDPFAKLGR